METIVGEEHFRAGLVYHTPQTVVKQVYCAYKQITQQAGNWISMAWGLRMPIVESENFFGMECSLSFVAGNVKEYGE